MAEEVRFDERAAISETVDDEARLRYEFMRGQASSGHDSKVSVTSRQQYEERGGIATKKA